MPDPRILGEGSAPSPMPVPAPVMPREETWATVAGRKCRGKQGGKGEGGARSPLLSKAFLGKGKGGTRGGGAAVMAGRGDPPTGGRRPTPLPARMKPGKPPNSAAVIIICPEGRYEATAEKTKSAVDLASLGIDSLRVKKVLIGALSYEI